MRARAVAIAGLCAAVLCPAAPSHADGGTLTVTGTRSSAAWLMVKRTVSYDLDAARVDISDGEFGGFAIGRDFATLHTAYDLRGQPAFSGFSFTGVLKPGRYKVRLFTAGQRVTATIPWSRADVTLEPATPIDARVQIAQAPAPDPDGAVVLTLPQDGRTGVNTSALVRYDYLVGSTVTVRACLTRTASTCHRARISASERSSGTGLNQFGAGIHVYNSDIPTKGWHVRGEVVGTTAGLMTVVTLRFYP